MKLPTITTLLTFGVLTSALPFNATDFLSNTTSSFDISNTTPTLARRSLPFSMENEAVCVFTDGGTWGWFFNTWQWYIFAKGEWVQDHWPKGEHDKHGEPTHDRYAKHLIDKLHKHCGTILNWHFQYGNREDGFFDNKKFDRGEGLADFRTFDPTTKNCVEGAITAASRDFGGEVNGRKLGMGVHCHEIENWDNQWSPKDLWEKIKRKGYDVNR